MNFIVTSEQMKIAEQVAVQRGVSLLTLAENTASACFNYITKIITDIRSFTFAVLCGKGMNGGDGMLLASLLKISGAEVLCIFVDDTPSQGLAGDIYTKHSPALDTVSYCGENSNTVKYTLQNADVIIDCVFGTGFNGDLEQKTSDLFDFINNNCYCIKISVDLPSGVNTDTGQRDTHSFIPDITLVLGAYKKGLLSHPCCDFCGERLLMDIGLTTQDFTEFEARVTDASILSQRPRRFKSAHKGNFGRLLNVAGSKRYIGAALLSTKAAIKMGAGLVTLAAPKNVVLAIAQSVAEAVFIYREDGIKAIAPEIQRADAITLGCGLTVNEDTRKIVNFVIENAACPIILDADGINSISDNINVIKDNKSLILTPHPGEFSRMTGMSVAEIQSNRIDCAKLFAKASGAIVVLKGTNTVIAAPDGRVTVNPTGNAGLAKAGTGDVLTGIIGSLTAQQCVTTNQTVLYEAAVLGVYLHGLAADELVKTRPLHGLTAGEIAETIGEI